MKKKKIPNAHKKFRQAHIEAKSLASLTSEATGKKYEHLNLMKHIAHLWENDKIITTAQIGLFVTNYLILYQEQI